MDNIELWYNRKVKKARLEALREKGGRGRLFGLAVAMVLW